MIVGAIAKTDEPLGLREIKRRRSRAALIEIALMLFDTKGYAATTIGEIVATAFVSRGTFFNYFSTKEGILLAWASDLHAELAGLLAESEATEGDPWTTIEWFARTLRAAAMEHPVAWRELVRRLVHGREETEGSSRAMALDLASLVEPLIAEGQVRGEVRDDVPADRLTTFVADALETGVTRAGQEASVMADTLLLIATALDARSMRLDPQFLRPNARRAT